MTKGHRKGGKFSSAHSTVIEAAGIVADIAVQQKEVKTVSLGIIKAGLPSSNGQRRIKFTDFPGGLLLQIRDHTALQEIRIYTEDVNKTREALARGARNEEMHISFGKGK